jgi:hypothetical protein
MRWFKHFTDNHRGQSIQLLFGKMGHMGPSCYYTLMEMCAEKLENIEPNVQQKFRFHEQLVRRNLHISSAKLQEFLRFSQEYSLLFFKISEEFIEIDMPILLNLLDRDMKKARSTRGQHAQNPRLDIELDKELELDVDVEVTKTQSTAFDPLPTKAAAAENSGLLKIIETRVYETLGDTGILRHKDALLARFRDEREFNLVMQELSEAASNISSTLSGKRRYFRKALLSEIGVAK